MAKIEALLNSAKPHCSVCLGTGLATITITEPGIYKISIGESSRHEVNPSVITTPCACVGRDNPKKPNR